jgi:hypothetical protein
MNIGAILLIILVIVLLGGIGPHFYSSAPWQPGYGYGWGVNGAVGVVLIVLLILLVMGRM